MTAGVKVDALMIGIFAFSGLAPRCPAFCSATAWRRVSPACPTS
jgi:hypothetical protein